MQVKIVDTKKPMSGEVVGRKIFGRWLVYWASGSSELIRTSKVKTRYFIKNGKRVNYLEVI